MSENVGGIVSRGIQNVQPRLLQKATGVVNDAIEGQQPEATEPLAQVPGATLRAMMRINQGENKPNQVQQDTQPEQNQIQPRSVQDIISEIKEKTFDEDDDIICGPDQYNDIVGLFNQAIESAQNLEDLKKIIRQLSAYTNAVMPNFLECSFCDNDVCVKQVALYDKLYNKIVSTNCSEDYNIKSLLNNLFKNCNLMPMHYGLKDIINSGNISNKDKAKIILANTKIASLTLRTNYGINLGGENTTISNILTNLDTLNNMHDINASELIEEWFGNGETIDSVKEKAFASLGVVKPTSSGNIDTIQTWFREQILRDYLATKTKDKQKELLSCFYPPGDGEQEKEIRQMLDERLSQMNLPIPDLNGKHYDEQRLIWVTDEVAPAQTEEQALGQQQVQVANTTQKAHAEKPFRLTKELAQDIYELYSNDGTIFNLETLQEDNRILEQQLEYKDKLATQISHLKTYSKYLLRKIYTEDPVIYSAIERVYFLLVDLENRKTIEEKKQVFEQNKERFASLGFSSLENFYATMHGEKEPE